MNSVGRPRIGHENPETEKRTEWLRAAGVKYKTIVNYRLHKPMTEDGFRVMLALAMREAGKFVPR